LERNEAAPFFGQNMTEEVFLFNSKMHAITRKSILPLVLLSVFNFTLCCVLAPAHGAQADESAVESAETENADSEGTSRSVLTMMFTGNIFGLAIVILILVLSVVCTFFIIEHAVTITRSRLMPEELLLQLEEYIARGEINQAITTCHDVENYSLSTEVILAGLERFQGSEYGFAEYRSAVEEAGEDFTGRLYRKTEVLNVIGSIAPMLGLTGTVVGMIEAFNTIASAGGSAKPDQLAGGIGQALITTLLGLVVAIPAMVAFSYFRNKIDSIVAEAGKRIERVMMPLGRKKGT
jgi:biopolymer transport protein ExbB